MGRKVVIVEPKKLLDIELELKMTYTYIYLAKSGITL